MKRFAITFGFLFAILFCVVGIVKVGFIACLLVLGGWTSCMLANAGREYGRLFDIEEPEHDSCDGCKNDLGGGHCAINLEAECGKGNHEAWKGKE